jgi:hypothetical protein
MDFFILSQDDRISGYAEPVGVSGVIDVSAVKRNDIESFDDTPVQVYIKEKVENEYLDFIDKPVHLISEKMKQIFEMRQKDIFFKPVVLADMKRMKQDLYWLAMPTKVECLSDMSEFNKDGSLRKLVINQMKASDYRVFKIEGVLENYLIVNTDIAESILRNELFGFILKKIEKEI